MRRLIAVAAVGAAAVLLPVAPHAALAAAAADGPVADGYAVERDNSYTGCGPNNITRTGSFTSPPYAYTLEPAGTVAATVTAGAGTGHI
jgi:pectate lyase